MSQILRKRQKLILFAEKHIRSRMRFLVRSFHALRSSAFAAV